MPYRDARPSAPTLTPEAGIVDDMVRQFADRHAFLRELVQNGIDAGASRIDVRLERSPDGAVRTSVEDDGAGMTRQIIEGPLLTLFQSSKESDSSKIGKYGIGFVSVFALAPERVEVRTRTARESWLVRLFGDHSFELATDSARAGTGTVVTLVQAMDADPFAHHVLSSEAALSRWCRHARVPITFVVTGGYEPAEPRVINTPLDLPGAAVVSVTENGETFVVAVGPPPDDAQDANAKDTKDAKDSPVTREGRPTFSGFYNRGLTLFESEVAEEGLQGVRFKIESARLSHTLSRDNIRRDDESRRLLRRVRSLVDAELWQQLLASLEEAAHAGAAPWVMVRLLEATLAPPFVKKRESVRLPLVDPMGGQSTIGIRDLLRSRADAAVLVADASNALTRALASSGRPVLRHVVLQHAYRALFDAEVLEVAQAFAIAIAVDERDEDRALVTELARFLDAAQRTVGRVRLARFEGVASDSSCRVVATSGAFALSAPDAVMNRPWGSAATIFLNEEHATVRLARRRAKSDPTVAAHLLARAIAIAEGPLDAKIVDRLLDAAGRTP